MSGRRHFLHDEPVRYRAVAKLLQLGGLLTRPINFRLYYRIARHIGRFAPRDRECIVKLADDTYFAFHLADPYWNRLLYRHFRYEPDLEFVLNRVRMVDYTFFDLGANYGYWSVRVSSASFGAHPAVSVEPVRLNFEMLSRNCLLNNERFTIRNQAITRLSGQEVALRIDPLSISNPGAAVVNKEQINEADFLEKVSSISIDDLLISESCTDKPVVIKLDVEGMETDAIRGAQNALCGDSLLIYEDHGHDRNCKVTELVLEIGFNVFYSDGKKFNRITNLDEVRAIKKQKSVGYNFSAVREGSFFSKYF